MELVNNVAMHFGLVKNGSNHINYEISIESKISTVINILKA